MNFGNFGFGEILIILVIVLLLFGAKRIPEIAGSLGKGITEFKRNLTDAQKAIQEPSRTQSVSSATCQIKFAFSPKPSIKSTWLT